MKIALRKAIEEESLVLYKENAERKKNHSFYTIRCLFVITQTLKEDIHKFILKLHIHRANDNNDCYF